MRRVRWGRACLYAVCLAAGIYTGAQIWTDATAEYSLSTAYQTVRSGDTVWTIAGRYFKRQDRYRHFGEFVHSVTVANGGAEITPGQVLRVPLEVRHD